MAGYTMTGRPTEDVDAVGVVLARRESVSGAHSFVGRVVSGPLFLALAYYAGAQVGFALTSPTTPQSVLWLPNSIVLAVLLVVPVSRWPLYLLAAFPAQLFVATQTGAPVVPLALLFITNCADASLGAAIVRRLSRGTVSFSDLRTTLVFMVFAATLSPVLLSFADAAITVATGWGSDYWAAFTTRVRSNVLTHLVVVPAIVTALNTPRSAWRMIPAHRYTEALAVLAGLLAAAVVSFGPTVPSGDMPFRGVPAPFVLPFLLWLAVRFGPGMTGLGLLVLALVASWSAMHLPGVTGIPLEHVIARLQFLVAAMAVPLLCLASVIGERAAASAALRRSYDQIRALTSRVSTAHETERARIAGELDDDVNQRATALGLALSGLRRRYAEPNELQEALAQLQRRTTELTERIRSVSRQLHPGELRRMALAEAVRGLCADAAARIGIEVTVRAEEIAPVSDGVGLCIYRVLQEALRNAVTHGQARRVDVTLRDGGGELELTVADDGRGFDGIARRHGGLGLVDIEDRVRLVGGTLVIEGGPRLGTRLRVRVPLGGSRETHDALTSR
ncbi:MAG TPA: MASE1 domain-containing protein [Gemmatimonadaceae bacterium]|nr:MASE1 domain-containing protein [Gemmatimonadaceae bacterium]